ncbi:MAG: hypothetical protein JWM95_1170, partial [Gemmatimonadetes bacterium]|nr:hypothetical protein [Gemmatimonadota bacterium]
NTITFSGSAQKISSGTAVGVSLSGNTGATVNLSGGGLAIATTTGSGVSATGGGTVTVTGANNTIASVGGVALNVNGTTIGASGLTFKSISANGGTNGIVLNGTGSNGGLTVTGDGSANSGGTIQNVTGAGISLTTAQNLKFNNLKVLNSARSGVEGTAVVNFEYTNGTIDQSGDAPAPGLSANESNLLFYDFANTATSINLSGVVTITGNALSNALNHGLYIYNRGGTISNLNVSSNVITTPTATTASVGSGIVIDEQGGGASITKGNIDSNQIFNVPVGAGIQIVCGSSSVAGTCGTPGSATNIISISSNKIWGASAAAPIGSEGLVANMNGKGQGNFLVNLNNIKNTNGRGMGVSAFGQVTMQSAVTNNTIVSTPAFSATNMEIGADSTAGIASGAVYTATVTGNNISGHDGVGIYALARGSSDVLNVKIIGNTIAAPISTVSARAGIRVDAGSASGAPTVCARIETNTTGGSNNGGGSTSPGINFREQTVSGANFGTLKFHNLSPASGATKAQAESYVTGLNPGSTTGTFGTGGAAALQTPPTYESCSLP